MKPIAILALFLAPVTGGLVGCGVSSSVVPDAAQLTLTCRERSNPEELKQFEVADSTKRARFVDALRRIDWSQDGVSLAEAADMRMPDIDLLLIDRSGASHVYQFYWDGDAFLDSDSGRLLTADVAPLRAMVFEVTGLPE